jgi:hypothetical protein
MSSDHPNTAIPLNEHADRVVIGRKEFDRLVGQALVGDGEVNDDTTTAVLNHVCRLNPHYAAEVARQKAHEAEIDQRNTQMA